MSFDGFSADEARALGEWVDRAIHQRRSVRAYSAAQVESSDIQAILESARWAPSPHNSEPWRFVLLRSAEPKQRLARAMGERWAADLTGDGWTAEAIEAELHKSFGRITEAPVVVVVCLTAEGLDVYPDPVRQNAERMMAAHSVGSAVQNMMLTAYARGLATGWMCAPLFCPDTVVEALGVSADFAPQGLITIGYPESWPKQRKRLPMDELVVDLG
jgi:F420 biosynthesis protein FbiB-like protein